MTREEMIEELAARLRGRFRWHAERSAWLVNHGDRWGWDRRKQRRAVAEDLLRQHGLAPSDADRLLFAVRERMSNP